MQYCPSFSLPYNLRMTGLLSLRISLILILVFLAGDDSLFAQISRNVYNFDIQGLKLNMNMDEVIKELKITNIKVNKDAYGLINGYEIKKRLNQKKIILLLSFTGEKRLYRIHYSKLYDRFRSQSTELFNLLKKRYGAPWTENASPGDQKNRVIHACWGSSCKKYPQNTPILNASVYHASGRLKLMLSDNRIFNKDWKKYKQKLLKRKAIQ